MNEAMNKKEDILATCVANILTGENTLEDCIARYPRFASELTELIKIARSIEADEVAPSPQFRQRAREHLMQVVQRPEARKRATVFWPFRPLAPARRLGFVVIASSLFFLFGSGGVVFASQRSLPDDTLYPVKTGIEKLQLAFALSPESRTGLHLKFAERRVDEVVEQSELNRVVNVSVLTDAAKEINSALGTMGDDALDDTAASLSRLWQSTLNQQVALDRLLTGVPSAIQPHVEQALDAARRGNLIAEVAYENPDFLKTRPSVLDEKLEEGKFRVTGILRKVDGLSWNIDGTTLNNVRYKKALPPVGSRVRVEGLVTSSGTFIKKVELEEDGEEGVKVEGRFGGTDHSGQVWNIGGLQVSVSEGSNPPSEEGTLEVRGTAESGTVTIKKMESREEVEDRAQLEGILAQVNISMERITVKSTGTEVTVAVKGVPIKTDEGKLLVLSDLKSLLGEEVKILHPYVEGGILRAGEIRVHVEDEDEASEERSGLQLVPA